MATAKLALENGLVLTGTAVGAAGEAFGEVVFNTAMTGYQEILTDPSYCGQIVAMTFPQIGNTGVNGEDVESARPRLSGFVVREVAPRVSNYRHAEALGEYLARHGVVGVTGVDTRRLVLAIRAAGAMRGVVSTTDLDDAALVEKARRSPSMVGRDLVREVMPAAAKPWRDRTAGEWRFVPAGNEANGGEPFRVVALDYGMKWNIGRCLVESGCEVTVVPGAATAEEVMSHRPEGVFLSNGPGDPEPLTDAVDTVRRLVGTVPVFGICLGHQLLARAVGAGTFKLKFGHRGANQPVRDLRTGRVEITTQNHGFAVDTATLPADVEATHVNLNDGTLEGLRHKTADAFSVQYHPEASAGPHDSAYLFGEFADMMRKRRGEGGRGPQGPA